MDANEAQKHAHQMVGALRAFAEAEQVLKAAAQAESKLNGLKNQMSEAEESLGKTRKSLKSARDRLTAVEEQIRVHHVEADAKNRQREKDLQVKLNEKLGEAQAKVKELTQAGHVEKAELDKAVRKGRRELSKLTDQITTARGQLAGLQQTLQGQVDKLSA